MLYQGNPGFGRKHPPLGSQLLETRLTADLVPVVYPVASSAQKNGGLAAPRGITGTAWFSRPTATRSVRH